MRDKMRKGFTLVELIVVIAIIGVLGTIGYRFAAEEMMKAKAQKVASSLRSIQKAIADTVGQTGGYYQSTGTTNTALGVASPQELPTPVAGQTCGYNASSPPTDLITIEYLDGGSPVQDTTCHAQNIEKALHDNLMAVGMKWVDSTHDFRLPSEPLAHISFPFEVNGVRTIRIWGIQGDLAFAVFQTMNGTKNFSREDGWTPQKPVALAKIKSPSAGQGGSGAKYGAGTELACLAQIEQLDTTEKSFNCIVNGSTTGSRDGTVFYMPGEEEKAKNAPKVVLYYTYAFGYSDGNPDTDNTTGDTAQ